MALNIIIDIVLVLTVLGGIIWGLKVGFVRVIAKPVKTFASFIIAYFLASPVGDAIFKPIVLEPVSNKLAEYLTEKCGGLTAETASSGVPTILKFAAALFGVNIEEVVAGTEGNDLIRTLVSTLADPFVTILCAILAFIAVFFLSKFLLTIVIAIINKIVEKGTVGSINKVLGCIFGVLFSFVIAWSLVATFDFIISLPVLADEEWVINFDGGYVYRFFRSISPIDLLLSI